MMLIAQCSNLIFNQVQVQETEQAVHVQQEAHTPSSDPAHTAGGLDVFDAVVQKLAHEQRRVLRAIAARSKQGPKAPS